MHAATMNISKCSRNHQSPLSTFDCSIFTFSRSCAVFYQNAYLFPGMFSEDWQELQHKDTLEYNPYRVLGGLDFALPNRVAYEYDLRGPRYDCRRLK